MGIEEEGGRGRRTRRDCRRKGSGCETCGWWNLQFGLQIVEMLEKWSWSLERPQLGMVGSRAGRGESWRSGWLARVGLEEWRGLIELLVKVVFQLCVGRL